MALAMLWVSYLALTAKTWLQIYNDILLCDAGRYMQGIIEKDIGYESSRVNVRKDIKGSFILECQNICGNKIITIYAEDVRLLKKVKTGNGTGSNALYINGCNVENWQVNAIDNKKILISFWLKRNESRKLFKQVVHCYNGEVINNA